jgi:hypothetical protein
MPFSDEIIGSVVFYACLLRYNKDNTESALKIINKYRADFLYYDLLKEHYQEMMIQASLYLRSIHTIFVEMFNFGQAQVENTLQTPTTTAGGKKKHIKSKGKKEKMSMYFY